MTVGATAAFEMTVATVIRRAYQVAGLLEAAATPNEADTELGRDFLQLELDELQAAGNPQRHIERTTKALVAGTAAYALDADCIDVMVGPDNIAGTIVPSTGAETPVFIMSRAEYVAMSDKTSQATPTRVFIEKAATITATFWPLPPASPGSFRFSQLVLPRDVTDASTTPDVDRRRLKALIWSLAYSVATTKAGVPVERLRFLERERDRLKGLAKMDDVERGYAQFVVT